MMSRQATAELRALLEAERDAARTEFVECRDAGLPRSYAAGHALGTMELAVIVLERVRMCQAAFYDA